MEDTVEVSIGGAAEATEMADQLTDLYVADSVGSSKQGVAHFSRDRFKARLLDGQANQPGFAIATARANGELIGYMFGCPLPVVNLWWGSVQETLSADLIRETGSRTFALLEGIVRRDWRGRKIASALYAKLLEGRHEERITLMVRPENESAYAIWKHYGYQKIGTADPAGDGTTHLDVLVQYMNATASIQG